MSAIGDFPSRLPGAFLSPGISSFSSFLAMQAPDLLPAQRHAAGSGGFTPEMATHGTTIVAATYADGVIMAGDRRATSGNMIAQRDIEKVFPADPYSVIGIAGSAGIAVEMTRLYQVELEHYEKLEGVPLSLRGKAHRLSNMIRGNLSLAMQGFMVVPIFAGYDLGDDRYAKNGDNRGRIFGYDPTGSMHEEKHYHSVGSGSVFAKSALKKRYKPDSSVDEIVRTCVEALYDAADDDTATGGPDLIRKLYPTVLIVDADGVRRIAESEIEAIASSIIETRKLNPGG
ncbi:MAG TPA: proteasome subunit beta [Mycobacteriales bacterium]|nr:proteasome subunit beta [Mycobacteriales bacterium]